MGSISINENSLQKIKEIAQFEHKDTDEIIKDALELYIGSRTRPIKSKSQVKPKAQRFVKSLLISEISERDRLSS